MIKSLIEKSLGTTKRSGDFIARMAAFAVESSLGAARMKDEASKRHFLAGKVHSGAKAAMKSLGYEVKAIGFDPAIHGADNFLIVANHVSYLDPFVMASILPTLFVTSVDMGETPVLGHACHLAGCIFVERRNRTTVEKDIEQMTMAMKDGLNVTIFPEGTSTDGRDVIPFKKSLLMSSVFAGKNILPITIKYVEVDGKPFSDENRDLICWYGDDSPFVPHFLKLMGAKNLKVELHFLPVIKVRPDSTRQELAAASHEAIRNCYLKL